MKILVVGSSINLGSKSWVSQLQNQLNCEIVNLSIVSAGNGYVHDTTILELSKREYDLVLPVWNSFKWVNFRNYQHSQVENSINNLNPYKDLAGGDNWLTVDTKFPGPIRQNKKEELYESYFYFCDNHTKLESSLLNIISLQGFLKSRNIPYLFSFYRKIKPVKRFEHLYNLIDYSQVHNKNLYNIAIDNNWWDGKHPTVNAHTVYADTMLERINTMNLIKT